jgi:sarcosine oxidase
VSRCDAVVVGMGVMGAAAAWHLSRRGRRVIALERFARGHDRGSSHGAARIFRLAYEQDDYVRLAVEALPLWRTLEEESGAAILTRTGAVDYGNPAVLDRIGGAMRRNGIEVDLLDAGEARRRWPGIAFRGQVLFSADGGRTDADAARAALQDRAAALGADVRFSTPLIDLQVRGDHRVVAVTAEDEIEADVAVIAANAWTSQMLYGFAELPTLRVTQEQPAFFAPRDPEAGWPSFIHYVGDATLASDFGLYGLHSPAEGGVKVGEHGRGPEVEPDGDRPDVDPASLERLARYVADHLPGLDPEPLGATRCLYATTPDEDFVVDRVGPVVIAAGFSGHGFKFAPAIGRVLADLADGAAPAPARFALDR